MGLSQRDFCLGHACLSTSLQRRTKLCGRLRRSPTLSQEAFTNIIMILKYHIGILLVFVALV